MPQMKQRLKEVGDLTRRLRKEFPGETAGFLDFIRSAEAGPALSIKHKELVNVALSIAAQCEWCVAFHVQNAVKAGATRGEILEAGFQAVIMHGGPAFMWMTPLYQALDEFAAEAQEGSGPSEGGGHDGHIHPALTDKRN